MFVWLVWGADALCALIAVLSHSTGHSTGGTRQPQCNIIDPGGGDTVE